MNWTISNDDIRVEGSDEELAWLGGYLVFTCLEFNPWKRRYETKEIRMLGPVGKFPTGLGRVAYAAALAKGFNVEVLDVRTQPCVPNAQADLEWLKHHPATPEPITHQIDAVQAVWKNKRGIIKVPTGGGKTEIAAGIIKSLPCNWTFLVHRGDLLDQTAERFTRRLGVTASKIGDGVWDEPSPLTVATFQTLYSRIDSAEAKDLFTRTRGLIVDECHTLPAMSFLKVVTKFRNAYYRVGLSGTPLERGDNRNIFVLAHIGPILYSVQSSELVEKGIIARPRIRMVKVQQKISKATFQGVYGEAIVRSSIRQRATLDVIQRAAKPSLVFVQQVSHGKKLRDALERSGTQVEFMYGKEPIAVRRAAIERLERGDTKVLVCNVIFQEGVDIPLLRSVVIATAGKSTIAALQRIGRGMRAGEGKHEFEVWDIADWGCGCRRGEGQHNGCKWLEKHTRARMKAYKTEGHEVEIETPQSDLALDVG